MELQRIIIVACHTCHKKENGVQHVMSILFEFEDEVQEWPNPSPEVVRMCSRFPQAGIVYQNCNRR